MTEFILFSTILQKRRTNDFNFSMNEIIEGQLAAYYFRSGKM